MTTRSECLTNGLARAPHTQTSTPRYNVTHGRAHAARASKIALRTDICMRVCVYAYTCTMYTLLKRGASILWVHAHYFIAKSRIMLHLVDFTNDHIVPIANNFLTHCFYKQFYRRYAIAQPITRYLQTSATRRYFLYKFGKNYFLNIVVAIRIVKCSSSFLNTSIRRFFKFLNIRIAIIALGL